MPRRYVDTSAYLAMLLKEKGSEALMKELDGSELVSSSLLVLEAYRTIVRLSRERVLSPTDQQRTLDRLDEDLAHFRFRDLTLDLCRAPVLPVVSTPRSLDMVHLRTALWFHQEKPLTRFVSVDAEQNRAARELGLPV